MNLKKVFKKQGGFNLIKNYWRGGALGTAVLEFLLLGNSRTGLEILRLSATLKVKQKLRKKYQEELLNFKFNNSIEHKSSNNIWFCWFQGLENAPQIVKVCFNSLEENLPNKNIIIISKENMGNYVSFPEFIMEKWRKGIISNTHMTDLLRLELLTNYGGTWIDATVLCTEKEDRIPEYFFNSDLFFYQMLKPGRDGNSSYMSSWFINAKSHNKILEATKYLCYKYWEKNNYLVDYFLLHDFMSIVLDEYPEEWNKIIPRDNAAPHELLLRLFNKYDKNMWDAIISQTPFHKLTYKFSEAEAIKEDTFYKKIINNKRSAI
ncbi:capsular polysaccharide synthesis protein [Limosilactobacillus pontis]|uniref:capsular polysaccharide synthesis protein n=1 Tax=Limosilactobacillus pontis TaxID=35787 RepID=UPI002F2610B7